MDRHRKSLTTGNTYQNILAEWQFPLSELTERSGRHILDSKCGGSLDFWELGSNYLFYKRDITPMNTRTIALGAGTAVTTFLLTGAATIELLGAGEAPATGIIGVFVGLVIGLLVGGIVSVYADRLSGIAASALVAYATFGVAFVAIAGMSYVNVPGVDDVFSFPIHIGVSFVAALIVSSLASHGRRGRWPALI